MLLRIRDVDFPASALRDNLNCNPQSFVSKLSLAKQHDFSVLPHSCQVLSPL
jgi:hypothetical protein